jgi:signal transduction histidine kinase
MTPCYRFYLMMIILWLGCNRGICRISKRVLNDVAGGRAQLLHPMPIGAAEGLAAEQCVGNFGAAVKLADGRLCFSTVKGIAVIDPRKQLTHLALPLVLMQDVLMDDKPLLPSGAKQDGLPVYLAAKGPHVFQLFYTGLNYDEPERIQFKYQLEGYDLHPVDAGTGRSARYNYLAPGTYRFRVYAGNSNAMWTGTGNGIVLIVPAYWWQTDLFKVVFTLICLVLVALIVRYIVERRYRAQMKRLEQENAMENERTRIARDLHDELGSSLTYISMAVDDLVQKTGDDAEKFQQRQKKISTFANRTARSLDEIVWAINPGNDSLRSLLAYLMQFAREHYEDSGVNCRFQIADDLPEVPLPPEMRHNIFLTVKEALNNALKYSQATEVHLIATFTGSQVEICVQDNGAGFDLPVMLATSERNGLTNMRKRVEKLGGKFSIETAPGKGTAIRLTVHCRTGRPLR